MQDIRGDAGLIKPQHAADAALAMRQLSVSNFALLVFPCTRNYVTSLNAGSKMMPGTECSFSMKLAQRLSAML